MPAKRKNALAREEPRNTRRRVHKNSIESSTPNTRARHSDLPKSKHEESDDELLLTPNNALSNRPSTPPRRVTSTLLKSSPRKTPRMFMDCVQIVLPSSPTAKMEMLRATKPSSLTRRGQANVDVEPRRSSRKIQKPIRSDQDLHDPVSSSPETVPQYSESPTAHILPETPSVSTPALTNTPEIATSLPSQSLSELPAGSKRFCQCLETQKRTILQTLWKRPHIDHAVVAGAEQDAQSTNDVAYTQLDELLKGTILRGEGNSCLVIGPCGSGKTAVGIRLYHVNIY